MYQIGLFSKMNRITIKTLRYYDVEGLLKPRHVNQETGYRYYSSEQIPDLHRLLALKQLGLPIKEIKAVLLNDISMEQVLLAHKKVLLGKLREATSQLSYLEDYLTKEESFEKNQVIIKELPEVEVVSCRQKLTAYSQLFLMMDYVAGCLAESTAATRNPLYCFTLYHDKEYLETDIDVEVCEAIASPYTGQGLVAKTVPKVPQAACLLHQGSYETLRLSYGKIIAWVEAHGFDIVGDIREAYIDGSWNKSSEADWLTEIQLPICSRK